jgi:enoyl-[acyl-carrier protein] reductase I
VSAVSFHKVMQVLYKKDAMNEWGVLLPYRIWQRVFRIIMIWQIIKLRVSCPVWILLEGQKLELILFPNHQRLQRLVKLLKALMVSFADKMAPLGNASALDCANYTVAMFSDLTKMVTLQNLYMMADSLIWGESRSNGNV